MAAGQAERWRLVYAASSHYVRPSLGGRQFTILGGDGGLLEEPVPATEVLLTPGDWADLAVGPFAEGEIITLESLAYDRGMVKEPPTRYATVRIGPPAPSHASIPATLRSIEPLVTSGVAPNRTVHLQGRPSLHGIDWRIDGQAHHHVGPVRVGELQVWDVVNQTKMDHPFHLHGFFFQVLAVNGAPPGIPVLGRHHQHPLQRTGPHRLAARRPAGQLDVPLPHPRPPRRRHDGPLRCHPLSSRRNP